MLKIAIPNKGSLSEDAVEILRESGYKCKRYGRELSIVDKDNDIEFIFLRPRDIAVYVANGTLDLGITGQDLARDSKSKVKELLQLGFGNSAFYYAVPKAENLKPEGLSGLRIATSYPNIVLQDLERMGISATVIALDGAVEISIKLGVADAIADVVSSGQTLEEAGLKVIGGPIMKSEAILIAHDDKCSEKKEVRILVDRLKGILVAKKYAVIEYDIPGEKLKDACAITPGIESPTVAPLAEANWSAVKSMVERKDINKIMDELKDIGAKGVIVMDIKTCRI
jgi:ATP phosphoribosyltransferase